MTQEQLDEMLTAAYKRADKYNTTTGVVLSAVAITAGFVLFGDALTDIGAADWKLAAAAAVGVSAAALFCLLGLSTGPMHAHLHEPEPATSPSVSTLARRKHRLELMRRLAQHVIVVNGFKAVLLRGAASSALTSLLAAYCAVVLSLSTQDEATASLGNITGWVLFGGTMATVVWFTCRFVTLGRLSRDQVLSDAEKTLDLIALTKYKRTFMKN